MALSNGVTLRGRALVAGSARGRVLRLQAPISLWGGVDPETGRICDPRHPDHDREIGGTVLVIPAVVGSSSTSAIMLELLRHHTAPAAVVVGNTDAILALGVIVGRELGYDAIPVVVCDPAALMELASGSDVHVRPDGTIVSAHQAAEPPN